LVPDGDEARERFRKAELRRQLRKEMEVRFHSIRSSGGDLGSEN
jgi:hypothetical protein